MKLCAAADTARDGRARTQAPGTQLPGRAVAPAGEAWTAVFSILRTVFLVITRRCCCSRLCSVAFRNASICGAERIPEDCVSNTVETWRGMPRAYVESHAPEVKEGFGGMMQTTSAENYIGKRIRLSGWIKTKDANEGGGALAARRRTGTRKIVSVRQYAQSSGEGHVRLAGGIRGTYLMSPQKLRHWPTGSSFKAAARCG